MGKTTQESTFCIIYSGNKNQKNFLSVISEATNADPKKVIDASKKLLGGAT